MNKLEAIVTHIQSEDELHLVSLKYKTRPLSFVSLDISLRINQKVTVGFKPTAVAIGKNNTNSMSYSNQLPILIKSIEFGKILTHIYGVFEDVILESIITTNSAKRLELKPQETVTMLIKANDIFIVRAEDGH